LGLFQVVGVNHHLADHLAGQADRTLVNQWGSIIRERGMLLLLGLLVAVVFIVNGVLLGFRIVGLS